tara:strand:+ start:969 stop:1709 length:741 start_codon:yes stop_codon:yes gene_type:complete
MSATTASAPQPSKTLRTIIITVLITLSLIVAIYWLFTRYLFPTQFSPVDLSQQETLLLNNKLRSVKLPLIGSTGSSVSSQQAMLSQRHQPAPASNNSQVDKRLTPEAYSEVDARREISFSERELNAILAHNTELADKLVFDLSDDLISVKWLLPLDPEFPLLGGKTLKFTAGVEIAYRNQQPSVSFRGLSLWGVPLPSAWMGELKHINLVSEYSGGTDQKSFWQSFAAGIDHIKISDGELFVKLKE